VQMTSSGSALILIGKLLQPTPLLTISGPFPGISNRPRPYVRDNGPPALMTGEFRWGVRSGRREYGPQSQTSNFSYRPEAIHPENVSGRLESSLRLRRSWRYRAAGPRIVDSQIENTVEGRAGSERLRLINIIHSGNRQSMLDVLIIGPQIVIAQYRVFPRGGCIVTGLHRAHPHVLPHRIRSLRPTGGHRAFDP